MVMIPLELSVVGTCQLVVNRASHGIMVVCLFVVLQQIVQVLVLAW